MVVTDEGKAAAEVEPGVWFWSAEVGPHRHADHLQRTASAHADCEPLRIFRETR